MINKYFDQHVHTNFSADSNEPIESYLNKANEIGINYVVFTDHIDFDFIIDGKTFFADLDKEFSYIDKIKKNYDNIHILKGVEVGYKFVAIDRINKLINKYDFDLVNLSVHDFEGIDFYRTSFYIDNGVIQTIEKYLNLVFEAVRNIDNFDVLCHIDYAYKTANKIDKTIKFSRFENILIKIMKLIIKKDKVLEINTKVQEDINSEEHLLYLLNLYKSLGGTELTISSDAHSIDRYYSSIDKIIKIVKSVGFDHIDFFIDRKRYAFKI